MIYNSLSGSDLKVSQICLGTMTFGEQNTEEEGHQQLDYAIERGINIIDTAEIYAVPCQQNTQGRTEKIIGTWLKKRSDRDRIYIATKVAGPAERLNYIRKDLGFSSRAINEALDSSLKRLQTDYIDIYQLHWPERPVNSFGIRGYTHSESEWVDNFKEVILSLEKLKKEGKIRNYGLSNETPWGVMRHLQICDQLGIDRPISNQNPYSLLNRLYEIGLAEISARENIGLLAYSPMAMGLLSGKYHKNLDLPRDRLNRYKSMSRYASQHVYDVAAKYAALADKLGLSMTQMSLSFVNSRPFVSSTIIGATTMEQLKDDIDSVNFKMTTEIEHAINEIHESNPNPAP